MKHFFDLVILKIEMSLNLISRGLSFRDLRLGVMKTQTPGNNIFKLVLILLSKMFYGHVMFIGSNSLARKDRDIYPFQFITVASSGYKD